jgi:hypothetical protein
LSRRAPDALFSRRTQALLASGVLALSVGATGTSIAAERDRQQEGVVAPEAPRDGAGQVDDVGSGLAPDTVLPIDPVLPVDPSLPVDRPPVAPSPESDDLDSAPLEHEPIRDPGADPIPRIQPDRRPPGAGSNPLALPDPSAPPVDEDLPLQPSESPPSAPAPAPETSNEVSPKRMPSLVPDSPPATDGPSVERRRRPLLRMPGARPAPKRRALVMSTRDDASQEQSATGATGPTGATGATESAAPAPLAASTSPADDPPPAAPIRPGARFHVVAPGESLWSIAAGLLRPGASDARVALEVKRLWRLNADRIDTGDPDLLPVGVKLQLR